jgi:phage terminase small subunit
MAKKAKVRARSGRRDERGLTPQQRLFALEYLLDRNGTQAAIRAGYSEKTARSQASDLLTIPNIQAFLEARLAALEERVELKLDQVVLELHRILTADPSEALNDDGSVKPMKEWPKALRRACSGFEVEELFEGRGEERAKIGQVKKFRLCSKTSASEQLLRVLGAFKDKVEHSGTVVLADPYAKPPSLTDGASR